MSTNERMTELGLIGAARGTTFWSRVNVRMTLLWRALKNRMALNPLNDFEDHQLADIGLDRGDVDRALNRSGIFDDPYHILHSARQRRRREFVAPLER